MDFFRKSIIRKLFLVFVLGALFVFGISYFFFESEVPLTVYIATTLVVFLIFWAIYYFDVVRPMRRVLMQMQNLLTGNRYKKVYTDRIDEVGIIAGFFNQVVKSIGSVSSSLKEGERMEEELVKASDLQRDILPINVPDGVPGLQIVAKNRPATELGGDSFNIFTLKGKTFIYIGDVTGHGVAAGLIMTMVNSLVGVFADIYGSAYEIVVNVNHYIKRHVKKSMFMTMVLLSWDHKKEKLSYVGAGHERILIYRMATGKCEAILSGGVALGMSPDNSKIVKEKEIPLADGDFVVLYTDGITDAKNEGGEMFGLERLKQSICNFAPQYSAEGVNYHIATEVSTFMGKAVQPDDMTLIVIKRGDEEVENK